MGNIGTGEYRADPHRKYTEATVNLLRGSVHAAINFTWDWALHNLSRKLPTWLHQIMNMFLPTTLNFTHV